MCLQGRKTESPVEMDDSRMVGRYGMLGKKQSLTSRHFQMGKGISGVSRQMQGFPLLFYLGKTGGQLVGFSRVKAVVQQDRFLAQSSAPKE